MNITLIKLGGSLITDKSKPYTAHLTVIKRLAKEIRKALVTNPDLHIVLGNGSGSFGHTSAAKYGTVNGYQTEEEKYGFCFVQNDAIKINRICVQIFIDEGINVIGVSPNNIFVTENNKITSSYLDSLENLIKVNIIPFLYGDTLTDSSNGCCIYSCDKVMSTLSNYLSENFKVVKIISVGDYPGVLDENNNLVNYIDKNKYISLIKSGAVKGSNKMDVTGGMKSKLDDLVNQAEKGIESIILDGTKDNNLFNCILGKEFLGTTIKI